MAISLKTNQLSKIELETLQTRQAILDKAGEKIKLKPQKMIIT